VESEYESFTGFVLDGSARIMTGAASAGKYRTSSMQSGLA
jgi:hypothetical protein